MIGKMGLFLGYVWLLRGCGGGCGKHPFQMSKYHAKKVDGVIIWGWHDIDFEMTKCSSAFLPYLQMTATHPKSHSPKPLPDPGAYIKGRPGRPWTPLVSDCKWCRTLNGHEKWKKITEKKRQNWIKKDWAVKKNLCYKSFGLPFPA